MIEIITKDGISLDLCPDDEFNIEYESPLFADDHIPVPYSTSISFLPTATNCRVFGYVDSIMLEPAVKEIDVEIRADGIPLFSGSLEYESYEDGKLNYNFSGKSIEDSLEGYIYEATWLPKADGQFRWLGKVLAGEMIDAVKEAAESDTGDFGVPMIVSAADITKYEYCTPVDSDIPKAEVSPNVKFRNWIWDDAAAFSPAVRVSSILSGVVGTMKVDPVLEPLFGTLAVLGLYYPDKSYHGFRFGGETGIYMDVADMLPECTYIDMLTNVLKILCASVWNDGNRLSMLSNSSVLEAEESVDWDDRVSDIYSLSREDAQIYDFSYGNDADDDLYSENEGGVTLVEVDTLSHMCSDDYVEESSEYATVKVLDSGDVYSWKRAYNGYGPQYMGDMLYHNLGAEDAENADSKKDRYDVSSDFILVKCIPISTYRMESPIDYKLSVCPIVDFPAMNNDRPKDIYIGMLLENQLVDRGPVYNRAVRDGDEDFWALTHFPDKSIRPQDLRQGLHKTFADWIEKDRVCVSVDLALSVMDIAGLRLWRKVYFRGRTWMIKKLSLTFSVVSDQIQVSGDFVTV